MSKWALITGASAGIGYEMAKVFAARGYNLVLCARREEKLEALAADVREFGCEVLLAVGDLSKRSAPRKLHATVLDAGVQVDVLVNNAGVAHTGAFAAMPLRRIEAIAAVNVRALTALTRLFLPSMVERRSGRIVNVASMAAFQPVPSIAAYAASKAFVLSFSEALSEELRDSGVRVTALCPGMTGTDMLSDLPRGPTPALLVQRPSDVAREAYDAVMRGDAVYVPGALNQAALLWGQLQPRWLVRMWGGIAGRLAIEQDSKR